MLTLVKGAARNFFQGGVSLPEDSQFSNESQNICLRIYLKPFKIILTDRPKYSGCKTNYLKTQMILGKLNVVV
jgi:hypothetical protein